MKEPSELQRFGVRRGEIVANSYRLGDVLGVGGMGVVYAAVQRSLDRIVAVKLPRPELAGDPMVRKRLQAEARASSRVEHRNSVRVLDFGDHAGAPFVVMEHVAGPRLGQILRDNGALPVDMTFELVRPITAALEEAHVKGIVHADAKCDNVLVETARDGTPFPRLIDWGIARFSDEPSVVGETFITGTPEYLAPEVILGHPPSFAADVYALGVMLYELMTGTTPFAGSAHGLMSAIEEAVVPPTLRCPDQPIPRVLEDVVLRALARDPAARYPDAGALGRALDDAAAQCPDSSLAELAENGVPSFSTEATTAPMPMLPHASCVTAAARRRLTDVAAQVDEADSMIAAYLELARALVDERRIERAIVELEHAVRSLATLATAKQAWRVLLALAALCEGIGDRARAVTLAHLARELARRDGSRLGYTRAERAIARLEREQIT